MTGRRLAQFVSVFTLVSGAAPLGWAQDAQPAPAETPPAQVEQAPAVPAVINATVVAPAVELQAQPPAGEIRVPEGTSMVIELLEGLSSKTANTGDNFTVRLREPVNLGGGVVIPAGYLGRGIVTSANAAGRVGKGGELDVRLDHLRIGDQRIPLRASQSQDGKDRGSTVALAVAVSPLFLLRKGKDVSIPLGHEMFAYTDATVTLNAPLAPAPPPR